MSRFEKLLEQQYLKLDLPDPKLTDVQKNVVDKITSFDGSKLEGIEKGCALVSYKHEGKSGKLKVDSAGKISSYKAEEAEEGAEEYTGTVSQDDMGFLRRVMGPAQQRKIDTASDKLANVVVGAVQKIGSKLGKIK